MKKNLLAVFVLLFAFSHAPLALADTSNVCDSAYPDATYQTYLSSSPAQQTSIKQTISETLQKEGAIQSAQPDTSTALSGLYGQLETIFQTSAASLKEKNGTLLIVPSAGGGDYVRYDMTADYINLVVQQLQTLGKDGIGTRFITSDYQSALAILGTNTSITDAYSKAIAATNVINTSAASNAARTCIIQLNLLQQGLTNRDSFCPSSTGYHIIQRNGVDVCVSPLDYCRDIYGGAGIAHKDGSCGVSCPVGYEYASSTQFCILAPSTHESSPIIVPSTASLTVSPTVRPTPIQKVAATIPPKPIKIGGAPTHEPAETPTSTVQSPATALPSTSVTSTQVSHPSFWTQFFHVLNPFSWFR